MFRCVAIAKSSNFKLFLPIHQQVSIAQKTIDYRPTDKLVLVTLGMLAGAETVYEINHTLLTHQPLLTAFGYQQCADQSVIQQTFFAATEANVVFLEQAIKQIWDPQNQFRLIGTNSTASESGDNGH